VNTRYLGMADYQNTLAAMREFTDTRSNEVADELWICEHPPVYTLGQAGRREHIHNPGEIDIVQSDRGGQVTYHGPGQVVVYTLVDLRRRGLGVRDMVIRLENSVIALLDEYGIKAEGRRDAPGVYVNNAKIAALGLRVRRGCTYHGLAMNIDADLAPFLGIDPCGYQDLAVTSTTQSGIDVASELLIEQLVQQIHKQLTSASDELRSAAN